MAATPKSVIDTIEWKLHQFDHMVLREAEEHVAVLEKRLAEARRILVNVRNERAETARWLREARM